MTRRRKVTLWAGAPRRLVLALCVAAGITFGVHLAVSHHPAPQQPVNIGPSLPPGTATCLLSGNGETAPVCPAPQMQTHRQP